MRRHLSIGGRQEPSRLRQLSPDTSPHTAAAGAVSPAWPRLASNWQGRDGPAGARRTLARQGASDFDPASHADFGAATHPSVGGGTHRRRATADRC